MLVIRLQAWLLLKLLLLLRLLLLHDRGPVQPDTTRATGQSTEGRGGLLLGLLLQTSSASIPGELLLRLLLMLQLLLLPMMSSLAGRLRIEHPVKVLNRSGPAERSRPGEVATEIDELGEVVHREPLLGHGTINAGMHCRSTGCQGSRGAVGGLTFQTPPGLTRDDVPQPIRLVVRAIVCKDPLPLRTSGRHVHRPLLA